MIVLGIVYFDGELNVIVGVGLIWVVSDVKGVFVCVDFVFNMVIVLIDVSLDMFYFVFGYNVVWVVSGVCWMI